MVIAPPEYSVAINTRHIEYEALVRTKQTNLLVCHASADYHSTITSRSGRCTRPGKQRTTGDSYTRK